MTEGDGRAELEQPVPHGLGDPVDRKPELGRRSPQSAISPVGSAAASSSSRVGSVSRCTRPRKLASMRLRSWPSLDVLKPPRTPACENSCGSCRVVDPPAVEKRTLDLPPAAVVIAPEAEEPLSRTDECEDADR